MEASDLLKESIKANSMKGELVFDPGEAGSLGGGEFRWQELEHSALVLQLK